MLTIRRVTQRKTVTETVAWWEGPITQRRERVCATFEPQLKRRKRKEGQVQLPAGSPDINDGKKSKKAGLINLN